jgi:uncharacterized membrane protein
LTTAAVLWTAVVFTAPHGLAGVPAVSAIVYASASLVCHQRPDRSFHAAGNPLPVCARCSGLYLSAALGALAAWFGLARMPPRVKALLVAAAIPTLLTVAGEWAGVASPSNVLRAAAALPLGAASGWILIRLLRAESSSAHAL